MKPFVGVDGEGGDIPDGDGFTRHTYTMLRAGDEWTRGPDWLQFLATRPKGSIYVSFAFDYDVTMMLKDAPEDVLKILVKSGEVRYGDCTLFYRPHKEFTVRTKGHQTTVNDVFTFFQCSFVKALERWDVGTPEERARIEATKGERGSFGELTAETVEYNRQECLLLAALMEKFRRACMAMGYMPRRWQGPGQLAKAMYRVHNIPQTADLPPMPEGVWDAAQAAYYGGRFETSAVGAVTTQVDAWDINSAYPYACTKLPCLRHGAWVRTREVSQFSLLRVRWDHRRASRWYGLPMRQTDGSIFFPRQGGGWVWGLEILAAQALGLVPHSIFGGWQYVPQCDCRPFDFMPRLYAIRRAVGKATAGIAYKLAMNSAYGITAQSVGRAEYANPIWAGLITATTRATILDALALAPDDVYMVATDGLFAKSGALPLAESETLGGWSLKQYDDLFIVQPGLYFAGDNLHHTRGVPLSVVLRNEQALRDSWRGKRSDGYAFSLRQFVALRLGVARGAYHQIGEWLPVEKHITYDWSSKRQSAMLRTDRDGVYRTLPHVGSDDSWSIPYERSIGGLASRDMERLEWLDMPDWAPTP